MANKNDKVILKIAAGASIGTFEVEDRQFDARPLKIKELRSIESVITLQDSLAALAPILTVRAKDNEPVQMDWLEEVLDVEAFKRLISFLSNPNGESETKNA